MRLTFSDLYKVLLFEIVLTVFIATGLVDRAYAFLLLAIVGAFFLTKPLKESLELFFVSLPFSLALPLGITDSISLWRPLSSLLAILWIWERKSILLKNPPLFASSFIKKPSLLLLSTIAFFFLLISTLSLLWVSDVVVGIKTIIYFINMFGICFIFAWEVKNKDLIWFVKKGAFIASFSLLIGFTQFGLTFMIPLHAFWQWWAFYPISAYYGFETSNLLGYSNTWFSYYGEGIPATLRMFSFLQDSHAFAMFSILGISLFLTLFYWYQEKNDKRGKFLSQALVIISLLAIILSGSRGAWLAAGILFIGLLILRFLSSVSPSLPLHFMNRHLLILFLFFLLFPLSSFLLYGEQKAQLYFEGREDEGATLRIAFLRARSTFDIQELSNKGRLEIWQDSLIFLKEKILTGTGIGNFPTVLDLSPRASRKGASAHSLYLQFLVELGMFGFLIFLTVLFVILRKSYWLIVNSQILIVKYYASSFLFAFLWVLLYSLFDVTLLNDKVLLFAAILVGMLYSLKDGAPGLKR